MKTLWEQYPSRRNGKTGKPAPEQALHSDDLEDDNYLPLSEDEVSLGDEDFIVPEEPLE